MEIQNNKKVSALVILLMLSMAASMMLVPSVSAHDPPWQIPTFAFVQAVINPIGVGQQAYVYMWIDKIPDGAAIANDIRLHDYKLTITAPDGTVTTANFPIVTDTTSNQGYAFTPTQVGTYTLKFEFPGQTYTYTTPISGFFGPPAPSAYINDTYLPSSATTTLTVQQAPIATLPENPLPTQYWTRPINGENPDWWTISSNWLGTGAPGYGGFTVSYNSGGNGEVVFPGDAVGPQTGHVMWTKPLQSGGVVGGNQFVIQGDTYFEGSAYQQRYTNPIIVDGKLFYTEPLSFSGPNSGPTVCVDLQTGKTLWSRTDVPALSFAYIYDVQDPNQHGVYPPILFAATGGGFFGGAVSWRAFDADTGTPMFNVTNIPTGRTVMGVNGEQLKYVFNNYGTPTAPNWYLGQWNTSNLWYGQYAGASTSPSIIPPVTDGSDARMYDWNVSVPALNTMPAGSTAIEAFYNDMVICYNGTLPSSGGTFIGAPSSTPYTYFAINLNPVKGAIGSILWMKTYDPPASGASVLMGGVDPVNRVFIENYRETAQFVGYSMDTGAKLWGPTAGQIALDYYGSPASGTLAETVAYGKIYSSAYGGILYCYDTANGNLLWTYGNGGEGNSTNSGFEAPGNYPTFVNAIGNDVVYLVTTEHTVETPIFKGGLARAVNATTGEEIWTLPGYTGEFGTMSYAIADGFATWFNGYDNQIYVVGRGPSATTVDAPMTAIPQGTSLVIRGTVTDISTGTTQTQQAANFPNGVPVISDASMKDWMGYVYMQKPCPANAIGVPVTLSVFDPNNNTYTIATTTSDADGTFAFAWTPPVPGLYKVTATFAGTNGYWGSHATTSLLVSEAASPAAIVTPTPAPTQTVAPTSAPTQTPASPSPSSAPQPTGGIPATTYIAIAAAVVIIAVIAAAIVLRRRK